jgi:chitinase
MILPSMILPYLRLLRCSVLFAAAVFASSARGDLWCTGYYPGWEQGSMPASAIDFSALTHIIHFSAVPTSSGGLDTSVNSLSPGNCANIVTNAHAAGKKVLFCVGGAGSQSVFQGATSNAFRGTFITNLVNLMSSRGYDGIDVDWEPLDPGDAQQYTNFINGLRAAMNAVSPQKLLTAAIASPPTPAALIAAVQTQFDQINLMTYDLSGAYPGWVTWFNAPIYDGGYRFPSTGGLVPSADGMVSNVVAAGVSRGKLGIGIAFYGWIWTGGGGTSTGGAALPRQTWTTAPTTTQQSYNVIMSTYYQPSLYRWDTAAQAAYLTIDNAGSNNDRFISYDDERTCQSKVSHARNSHLGGVMIWELAQDHQAGKPDPLLQAVKQAVATPGKTAIQRNGQDVDLSFASAPLGSYRVQWTPTLPQSNWNTLVITNVSGTGGVLHVPDPAPTQASKFYRVKTPP